MNEIDKIVEVTFPFVIALLKDYGEFYPLASVLNINRKVEQILEFEGNEIEFPTSISVFENLKYSLKTRSENLLAIAVFYEVRLKENNTDAVAIFVEDKLESSAFTFYYPYKIENKQLIFGTSWKTLQSKEIFTN